MPASRSATVPGRAVGSPAAVNGDATRATVGSARSTQRLDIEFSLCATNLGSHFSDARYDRTHAVNPAPPATPHESMCAMRTIVRRVTVTDCITTVTVTSRACSIFEQSWERSLNWRPVLPLEGCDVPVVVCELWVEPTPNRDLAHAALE